MEKKSYRFLWLLALGALIGALLATWLGPKGIVWYWDPPVSMGVNCKAPIEWSLQRYQLMQFVGLLAGAVAGAVLAIVVGRRSAGKLPPSGNY